MGDLLYGQRTMCNGDINMVPLRVYLLYLKDQQQSCVEERLEIESA
jgi:hypothetical protein